MKKKKKELQELINLLYNNHISQYGKRKLEKYIKEMQKEIEELKHDNSILCEIAYTGKRIQMPYTMVYTGTDNFISKDKIKEKMRGEINKSWRNTEQRKCQLYAYDILKELLGEGKK